MASYMQCSLMIRALSRSCEIAAEPGMAKEVTRVHSDILAPVAAAFCKSDEAVALAETAVTQKGMQAQNLLDVFDPVSRGARSVVLAFAPGTKLPDTLKGQRTDTDTLSAIATLVSVVKAHAGKAWADELMEGQFGTLAPKVDTALTERIAANKALAAARQQRANAYGPAYDAFIAFKRVVRDVLGSSSVQYRRLHPRASAARQIGPDDEAAPESGLMPSSKSTPVLVSGPVSVKAG